MSPRSTLAGPLHQTPVLCLRQLQESGLTWRWERCRCRQDRSRPVWPYLSQHVLRLRAGLSSLLARVIKTPNRLAGVQPRPEPSGCSGLAEDHKPMRLSPGSYFASLGSTYGSCPRSGFVEACMHTVDISLLSLGRRSLQMHVWRKYCKVE